MLPFLQGAVAMAAVVAGSFFVRFWRESRDRLFLFFAAAFWLMAAQWTAVAMLQNPPETRHYLYLIRIAAFALIIAGIIDKNRGGRSGAR
jgi:hypothetical protein